MNPTSSNHSLRPTAAAFGSVAGDWRLEHLPPSSYPLLGLAISAGVHAVFLLAFNQHGTRLVSIVREPEIPPIQWTMHEDPEPPPPTTEPKVLDDPPAVRVPQLTDIPAQVELQDVFVQKFLPNPPPPALPGERITRIPTNLGPGGNGPRPADIFRVEQLDQAPRAVAQPAPHYPRELQNLAVAAEVVVEFVVDTSGNVRSAAIVSSSHPGFDRAALDGVRRWKFRPGMKDGRKVNTRILQPIRFSPEPDGGR